MNVNMAISILHSKLVNIASSRSLLLIILLQFLLPSFIHGSRTMNTPHKKVPAIYFFGDSILDTGNNNVLKTVLKANRKPYGMDFKDHEATGRFSNGKLTTDLIASGIGVKEFVPPYLGTKLGKKELLTGVCFASAGSGYDPDTAKIVGSMLMSYQLDLFKEYKEKVILFKGEKDTNDHIGRSLYIVSGGANDVVQYFVNPFKRHNVTMDNYARFLAKKASTFLEGLVSHGAKKIGIIGMPPAGCTPFVRTLAGGLQRDCAPEYNEVAKLFNSHLLTELQKLNEKCSDKLLIYIDMYPVLQNIIDHPVNYGFQDSNSSCCGTGKYEVAFMCNELSDICSNPSSRVFFDSLHPTERASQILVAILLKKYEKYLDI